MRGISNEHGGIRAFKQVRSSIKEYGLWLSVAHVLGAYLVHVLGHMYKVLVLTLQAIHNSAPVYITDLIRAYEPGCQLHSASRSLLTVVIYSNTWNVSVGVVFRVE